MSQHAYVTGTKPLYTLVLSLTACYLGFAGVNGAEFTTYRCAQDIANAVNANVAKQLDARRKP